MSTRDAQASQPSQLDALAGNDLRATFLVSGLDSENRYIISLLVKRTYALLADVTCRLAQEQVPLVLEPVYSDADPDGVSLLEHDTDLFPFKLRTDVVLKGRAYAGGAERVVDVALAIGRYSKVVRVFGDRRFWRTHAGALAFTAPNYFEQMDLSCARAYGGHDTIADAKYGNPFEALRPYVPSNIDLAAATPYAYPRNPYGRGYVIDADDEALDRTMLPNLEDPAQLLAPETISIGRPGRWPLMPLPQSFGWYDYACFPRAALFGFVPEHEPLTDMVEEARRGYVPSNIMHDRPLVEAFSYQATNGAFPGLSLPFLAGNELVLLDRLHPRRKRFAFRLPCEVPQVTIHYNGKRERPPAVMHTLMIEPDLDRLTLLWRCSIPVQRPYFEQEMHRFPYEVTWFGIRPE